MSKLKNSGGAYWYRKTEASKMRAARARLHEIAKEFGSDIKTVKRWVGEA